MANSPDCPVCHRPSVDRFRPFCSRRCADVDLGRWLTAQYRVPAEQDAEASPGEEPD